MNANVALAPRYDAHCPEHGDYAGDRCGACLLDRRALELAPDAAVKVQDFAAEYRAAALAAIQEDDLGQRAMAHREAELILAAATDAGVHVDAYAIDEELRPQRFAAMGLWAAGLVA